ncbi:hypothetical protein [Umezawaea tangerina]|uniref:hypothetical protein n=1 Tax=Umezawaea tangerina TaxID=84725 RepID=UPI000D065890|nr:hypothetical protein [Umezawaea tangerina]
MNGSEPTEPIPADVAGHLECLAGSSAITEGWIIEGVYHDSRFYPIHVGTQLEAYLSPKKEAEFDP